MIYYIHENIIKDALYNRKKEQLKSKLNDLFNQFKSLISKSKVKHLRPDGNKYKWDERDVNPYGGPDHQRIFDTNVTIKKIYQCFDAIDKKFKNDSELNNIKKQILSYFEKIAKESARHYFSDEDLKTINQEIKKLIEEYNSGKLQTYIDQKISHSEVESLKPFKLICQLIEKNDSYLAYRVIPKSVPFADITMWLVDEISYDLYPRIKSCANGGVEVHSAESVDEKDGYKHMIVTIMC